VVTFKPELSLTPELTQFSNAAHVSWEYDQFQNMSSATEGNFRPSNNSGTSFQPSQKPSSFK
jgi:hypothetical protein